MPWPPVRAQVSAISSGAFSDLPGDLGGADRDIGRQDEPRGAARGRARRLLRDGAVRSLARAGTPPERLDVSADVTFDKLEAGWRVVSSALTVRGVVPGMSVADFEAAAEATKDGCPISVALTGNVALSVAATLES